MRRLLAIALLLAACASAPALTSGVVVGKGHEPARSWSSMVPIYTTTCAPPPGGCSMSILMWVPMEHHEPERWWLRVRGDDGRREEVVTISRSDFDRYDEGDIWP